MSENDPTTTWHDDMIARVAELEGERDEADFSRYEAYARIAELETEKANLRAAISRARELKPRDHWEAKDAGSEYCRGVRDVLQALGETP